MDEHSPDLHEEEKPQVRKFLQREDEWEEVVWQALEESIDRVESHGRIGRWHDPLVVCFMHRFVDQGMVQTTVDSIYAEIGEKQEKRELEPIVPTSWSVCKGIVELGVALHFGEEERGCEESNEGHGANGLTDFHSDLVLEEFRVFEGCLVEYKDIGEGGDDEVNCCAGDPRGLG